MTVAMKYNLSINVIARNEAMACVRGDEAIPLLGNGNSYYVETPFLKRGLLRSAPASRRAGAMTVAMKYNLSNNVIARIRSQGMRERVTKQSPSYVIYMCITYRAVNEDNINSQAPFLTPSSSPVTLPASSGWFL